MHEAGLIAALVRKVEATAREQQARRVIGVTVRLGALAHLSPDHVRAHFAIAASGTPAESARLDVEVSTDTTDPHAQDVVLRSVEIEMDP